jgi:hypothetical protein
MWSTVVLFVLTFAVFGLLLGFAEIYKSGDEEGQQATTLPATAPEAIGNSTSAQTQGNVSSAGG